MKAITLHQPSADLVAVGLKLYETRSWAPAVNLLGEQIAIHAGKRKPTAYDLAGPVGDAVLKHNLTLPLGVVVATARLLEAYRVEGVDPDKPGHVLVERTRKPFWYADHREYDRTLSIPRDHYGDFSAGRWIWRLSNIVRVETPIPLNGHQKFWDLPMPVSRQLKRIKPLPDVA